MKAAKAKGKGRIFKNPILEFFTKTNLFITVVLHSIVVGTLLFVNFKNGYVVGPIQFVLVFLGGLATWTLTEYCLHRYMFHFIPFNKFTERIRYVVHEVHHEFPNDTDRVFMPPLPALIILSFFFGLFYLIMGTTVFAFLPAFELGYFLYSFIHYGIHAKKAPKPLEHLWKHHILHHFKYPDEAFGVSSILWDLIFRTMPPKKTDREKPSQS